MIVLVVNAGSSSVKFTCFDMKDGPQVLAGGLIERIGIEGTEMKYTNAKGDVVKGEVAVKDAQEAVKLIAQRLVDPKVGVLKSLDEVKAIGHRVVHGGENITDPVLIDEKVKATIKDCFAIAPLHNPPNLTGIEACEAVFPGVPNVGVFDTAFHSTMPASSFLYALPYALYSEHKIRRYGFHRTSHAFVSRKAAEILGRKPADCKVIVCHLGNGGSVSAVSGGKCLDTSMGLTPLEGLVMGTRCGDLDPAIVWNVMKIKNLDLSGIDTLLNKKSGLLGMAGINSSDLRDVEAGAQSGNKQCAQAMETFAYRVKKYIGAYLAALGGADVVAFTAGVGENSASMRAMILKGLDGIGLKLDQAKNQERSGEARFVSTADSPIKIAVIPTDEEREIATQTLDIVNSCSK
ncbi:MAG: acetate kinase [Candidatus Adiutrix sp.]|jgi:acetate kinase|nr:acetate kinase [Candidatus Adiutrix sp.]